MDAPVVGSLLTVTANAVLKAIEFGWTAHREQNAEATARDAELKARVKLALHYWGCLLWEMRSSCERIRYMAEQATHGGTPFGVFDFTVSDAVMPDFCRVAPSPRLLASFQGILAAAKRVDFFQRAAARDELVDTGSEVRQHRLQQGEGVRAGRADEERIEQVQRACSVGPPSGQRRVRWRLGGRGLESVPRRD